MTIEERKNRIIDKIEKLSEEQMTTFENFLLEIMKEESNEEETKEDREEKIKSIIKNDFSRFKETFKALS